MSSWEIITTKPSKAASIMAKDAALLETLNHPIIHHYDWANDAATYGHFTKPEAYLDMQAVDTLGLDLAKRPTGGGIVFHICDLAFSVLLPAEHPLFSINTLDNYALINHAVIATMLEFQSEMPLLLPEEPLPLDPFCKAFCMAKPTKYDVILQGKKIGGASQRRTKQGLLHQGTICIALLPTSYLKQILLPGTHVLEAMQQNSASLLGHNWTPETLQVTRAAIRAALTHHLLNIDL